MSTGQFWQEVYIAAIRAGQTDRNAEFLADQALAAFKRKRDSAFFVETP